jgi:hypothetical protein
MPHLDVRVDKRAMAFKVIDLVTKEEIKRCVAIDTDRGWAIVMDAQGHYQRITGEFDLICMKTGKRWAEVM